MKYAFEGFIGTIGTFIAYLLGGWDSAMQTLLIFMLLDYITGVITAAVFRKSSKTKSGGLNSTIGLQGIFKKVGEIVLVMVAFQLDLHLGIDILRTGVIFALLANETISIIENLGLMGVPIPSIIKKAIDLLNEKSGEAEQKEGD